MPRLRIASVIVLMLICPEIAGCETAGDRAEVRYATLPTREVQATFPADFEKVHATCVRVIQDELGYALSDDDKDSTTGRGRFTGENAEAGSVRVETERSRDLATTNVRVFAVPAGATEASAERAREILNRVENALWSSKK